MKKWIVFALITMTAVFANAEVLVDLQFGMNSDSIKNGATDKVDSSAYGLGVLFNFKKGIWGGWNFLSTSEIKTGGSSVNYSGTDTGPVVLFQFGKAMMYNFSLAFNLLTKAKYGSETWDGTSVHAKLGIMPEVSNGLHIGASLNYYAASFNKVTVAGSQTNSSNTRTVLYPSIGFTKEW